MRSRIALAVGVAAKYFLDFAFWVLSACLLCVQSWAQLQQDVPLQRLDHPNEFHSMTSYDTAVGTAVVVFHVFAEKKGSELDRPVRLELRNLADRSGVYQIIAGHEEGMFTNVVPGRYDITASAIGYLSADQEIQVVNSATPMQIIDILLQRDPSAVELVDAKGPMSRKARKEARYAVSLLKADISAEAQAHLEKAYKLAPFNPDVNFLLGYLFFQNKDYARAETYLGTAESLSPHSGPTLTLLGRTDLALNNYPAATSALERAVLADNGDWLPHDLLADAYFHQKEYGKARDEAQIAIAKGERYGKRATGPAELVLAQALIGLGQPQEAIQALAAFVKASPDNPMIYWARALITELQKGDSRSGPSEGPPSVQLAMSRADPLGAVPGPTLSSQVWRPSDIDDVVPSLAPGITCPGTQVVAESGKRVQELVEDLARFTADEDLLHKSIDAFGFSGRVEIRKYNYVAMVSLEHGDVSVEESRSDRTAQEGSPDAIGSTGFVLLALVFHPSMQGDFEFNCEGQSEWQGQPVWLVHFRQRHDRPNRMHSYSVGGEFFPVDLKGRAWITTGNFQIVRMEADIVNPVHEIQLLSEHQTVEYGPVPFPKKNTTLWLPKDAEIYIDLRKHHYFRRHSFNHYMLFSVDTEEKPKVPTSIPTPDSSGAKSPS